MAVMRFRTLLTAALAAGVVLGAHPADAQTLRGSRGAVDRTYRKALDHDLTFYRTPSAVRTAARKGDLVKLTGNADYRVHQVSYPYVLPATRTFVQRLAAQYRAACGEKLVVTSAVRPKTYRLANSVDKSVHPAGMAVDIRKPRNGRCGTWLRQTLLHVEGAGAIDATEERYPPHFHVAVYPRQYLAYIGRSPASRTASSGSVTTAGDSAEKYRVRRGDSLWSIARRHRTSVESIRAANDLRGSRIVAGQVLVIPSGR